MCVARGGGSFVWSHMCGGTMQVSAEGPQIQRVRMYLGKRTKSSTSSGGSNMELANVCQQSTAFAPAQPPRPPPPPTSINHP